MTDMSDEPDSADPAKRRVVFVTGAARSGAGTLAGALRTLGMHVPSPEVPPDENNPRGHAASQWVVDLHEELLERTNVSAFDARPVAWFETGRLSNFDRLRTRVTAWLEEQFEAVAAAEGLPELVIKDPGLAWFTGLWRSAALRCDATPAYVTVLREVPEVVGSEERYAAASHQETQRLAGWVNTALHTERATRGSARQFVRYADLLDDWTIPVFGVGAAFDLAAVQTAQANDMRAVHSFVDAGLRRVRLTWDDLDVPARLREIAEASWAGLDRLAEPEGDQPVVHDELDELRAAYAELYEEAEALSQSTALAAHREGLAQLPEPSHAVVPQARRGGRGVERVPHSVRALVPEGARRGLRRALGRER